MKLEVLYKELSGNDSFETPEDRKSIAIEPMSSTGNAFFTAKSGLCRLNPGDRIFGEFVIELLKL